MKAATKTARAEYKNLLETIGKANILNKHFSEIVARTGITYTDMQNAASYFSCRKSGKQF